MLRFTGREDEVRAVRTEALNLYERKGDVVSAGRLRSFLLTNSIPAWTRR